MYKVMNGSKTIIKVGDLELARDILTLPKMKNAYIQYDEHEIKAVKIKNVKEKAHD